MRYMMLAAAAALVPAAGMAQEPATPERTIRVTGVGVVQTPPDTARLDYWVRGEGTNPDEASRALATRQKAIAGALGGLLGAGTEITTGNVMVIEVKDRACDDQGYNGLPRLSQGACAVTGYLARMQAGVRTPAIGKAGTAVGLAARLGASDARLSGFSLSKPREAQARATTAAIADAKLRAEAVAAGAGTPLGAIVTVTDQAGYEPIVMGARSLAAPPPPPPPPDAAPPVAIDVAPAPIETRQQVFVTYSIGG
ncbi:MULTISPECIES: SIMPL domain-containing protein [Sphingomonas]|uniref:SIMPL domain-containing protein n=2 Tax=Sphingomonas adhaesiva TaxID=28212 RepID=A0A2A4I8K2_9SPHN|nr:MULTISPECIES: SIMPL domain-containing protein [Sphingomonas]PCG14458.1 hypothetical protein COA07_07890 [Sphingomonas adhaesiva]PZU81019.1 MAG: DUF541 domain-containing protein [Sphingomonas sp.]